MFQHYFYFSSENDTMFRQAFLLSQYSFICEQYVKCSEMTKYTQYFLTSGKQTANCFNNILFILVAKISSKKVCEKTNVELLRLVGITFDSKLRFLRRMRKKKLIILKTLHFLFYLFVVVDVWIVKYQLKVSGKL